MGQAEGMPESETLSGDMDGLSGEGRMLMEEGIPAMNLYPTHPNVCHLDLLGH